MFTEKIRYKNHFGLLCPCTGAVMFYKKIYQNISVAICILNANNGKAVQNPLHRTKTMPEFSFRLNSTKRVVY
jgi:hypothetical protein